MNIKQLVWADNGDTSYTEDNIPQMLYCVRLAWHKENNHREYELTFQHGYMKAPFVVGRFPTRDDAKFAAQLHLEPYIMESYFE